MLAILHNSLFHYKIATNYSVVAAKLTSQGLCIFDLIFD